jgi:ribonuclease E
MYEATLHPTTTSESTESLEALALRAQAWYGEPFLHPGEDPREALAPGTARRAALEDAAVELDAGHTTPSPR